MSNNTVLKMYKLWGLKTYIEDFDRYNIFYGYTYIN